MVTSSESSGTADIVRLSSTKEPLQILPNGPDSVVVQSLVPPPVPSSTESAAVIGFDMVSLLLRFESPSNLRQFMLVFDQQKNQEASDFDKKIDKGSSELYFHYYGMLSQQQNMLQDSVRTGTYYWAF